MSRLFRCRQPVTAVIRPGEIIMSDQDDFSAPEEHLAGLNEQFMDAVRRLEKKTSMVQRSSFVDSTSGARLAEPRIELARILIETQQADEAEPEIREIRILENGDNGLSHCLKSGTFRAGCWRRSSTYGRKRCCCVWRCGSMARVRRRITCRISQGRELVGQCMPSTGPQALILTPKVFRLLSSLQYSRSAHLERGSTPCSARWLDPFGR